MDNTNTEREPKGENMKRRFDRNIDDFLTSHDVILEHAQSIESHIEDRPENIFS